MELRQVRRILHVHGMTCTGCETRIENALRKLDGVLDVNANYSSSNVYITYDAETVRYEQIIDAVERLDYTVINKPPSITDKAGKEKNGAGTDGLLKKSYGQLVGIGIILLVLYLMIKNTFGWNLIPEINQSMGYGMLFTVGLMTSLHCITMCGGINLSLCMQYQTSGDGSGLAKFKPSALYNIGRVFSYTLVGGIVGALGSMVRFSGAAKGIVAIISGVFMLIMGLNMLNAFPWLRKLNPRMPKIFGSKMNSSVKRKGPLLAGIFNGLMPCGPLQAMQLYALGTGSATAGALSMFLFSLGTVPLMFGFGVLSSLLSGKFTHKMMKVSAMLVIILGVVMLNRGLSLSGYKMIFSVNPPAASNSIAVVKDGIQYVTTELNAGRYSPVTVQKGIPVQWIIKAEESDLNGCNNPVTIPKFGIEKKLVPGDNMIEFIPEEEGNIVYTCWMGMISSRIQVVADINNVNLDEVRAEADKFKLAPSVGGKSGVSCHSTD